MEMIVRGLVKFVPAVVGLVCPENPHLSPISHFSGPNSFFFIKMPSRKWEIGCEHSKSSFPTSDFPFLTSHISFPASHIFIQSSNFSFLYDAHDHIIPYELFMSDF